MGNQRLAKGEPKNPLIIKAACTLRTALLLGLVAAGAVRAEDWPDWRGPNFDRHAAGTGYVDSFDPEEGTNVLWTNAEAGGISTPVILGGRLYTLVRHKPGTPEEAEKVLCLDAVTGEKIWENVFNVYLSDVPSERVGWSAVAADPVTKTVYAHGVCGYFAAIDAETGKTRWSRSLHEEFGFLSTYGGRTNIPVVFEDLVIASAVVTGTAGCLLLAAGLHGHLLRDCRLWESVALVVAALLLIKPGWITDLAGFGIAATILARQHLDRRRALG